MLNNTSNWFWGFWTQHGRRGQAPPKPSLMNFDPKKRGTIARPHFKTGHFCVFLLRSKHSCPSWCNSSILGCFWCQIHTFHGVLTLGVLCVHLYSPYTGTWNGCFSVFYGMFFFVFGAVNPDIKTAQSSCAFPEPDRSQNTYRNNTSDSLFQTTKTTTDNIPSRCDLCANWKKLCKGNWSWVCFPPKQATSKLTRAKMSWLIVHWWIVHSTCNGHETQKVDALVYSECRLEVRRWQCMVGARVVHCFFAVDASGWGCFLARSPFKARPFSAMLNFETFWGNLSGFANKNLGSTQFFKGWS